MSQSVEDLEREIAQTRARLGGTIDRIQSRLTVSGIVDEVMGQAGVPRLRSGHDAFSAVLRRHPIPVMVAAAGLGLLVYRMNKRAERLRVSREAADIPILNTGQARRYDPDYPDALPGSGIYDRRPAADAQA